VTRVQRPGGQLKHKFKVGAVLVAVASLVTLLPHVNGAQAATAVPGAPQSVESFPVVGATGVKWEPPIDSADNPPQSYLVQRRRPNGHWADASGVIDASTNHWVDTTVMPGESNDYMVLAVNAAGSSVGSGIVTATRPLKEPAVGSVNVLTVDVGGDFNGSTPLTDEVATPVTAGTSQGPTRTLSAGGIRLTLPTLMRGPGVYDVTVDASPFRLGQGAADCPAPEGGRLNVSQLAYTTDLRIAVMSAWFEFWRCGPGTASTFGEIRTNSTAPYSAISVSSHSVDFGRVLVGTAAERAITVTNSGTADLTIDRTELTSGFGDLWAVRNNCSAPLPPAASCTVTISYSPTSIVEHDAWFRIFDSTHRGSRYISAVAAGESPPSSPTSVKAAATLTGVDLSWGDPETNGSRPVLGFIVRRDLGGTKTEHRVPPDHHQWIDPVLSPGATYSVSAVNDLGEGLASSVEPAPSREQLAVFSGPTGGAATLGAVAVWGGTQVVPMGGDAPSGTSTELTGSPDGRSLAYTTAEGDNQVLWVRRADTAGSHPSTRLLSASAIHDPVWSPDGTRIAYTTSLDGTVPCVDIVPAAGGAAVRVGCSLEFPVWHPDSQTLIVRDSRIAGAPLARLAARPNAARIAVLPGSNGATHTAASTDGRWLAFVPADQTSRVAVLPMAGGTARLSPEMAQSSISRVSWRPDSDYIGVLSRQSGIDRINAILVSGGTPGYPSFVMQAADGQTIHDLTWQGLSTLIKPTPESTGPSPSIAFDSTALQNGSNLTCKLDEAVPVSCTSPYRGSSLTSGPHTLRVTAVEPGGPTFFGRKVVAARSFTVDATAPVARIIAPTFGATTASSAMVTYTATDSSGVASYDVRYRTASASGAFGSYAYPRIGTSGTSHSLGLAPGYEYCVSVRARDVFGNTSGWSAERCFSRPLDDRVLSASAGWTRGTASGLYYSTSTYSTRYDASLTVPVKVKRAYLLATKCPTCGVVSVYLGTRYLTAINLYAATTQRQALISLPAQTSVLGGTLRIATRSTGKLVQIDGLAIRQT
jgi:hypothetical protein